jgi:hypothetical protein
MAKWYGDDPRRKLLQADECGGGTLEQLAERFSALAWARVPSPGASPLLAALRVQGVFSDYRLLHVLIRTEIDHSFFSGASSSRSCFTA